MNPHGLEMLYVALGRPVWFWPAVMAVLLALLLLGSSVSPGVE